MASLRFAGGVDPMAEPGLEQGAAHDKGVVAIVFREKVRIALEFRAVDGSTFRHEKRVRDCREAASAAAASSVPPAG
jgi:hypothetical protein